MFNENWTPTKYEMYEQPVMMDDRIIDLELWDTSGKLELHQLQRLSYIAWDAVFICFSVNSDKKFAHAQGRVSQYPSRNSSESHDGDERFG